MQPFEKLKDRLNDALEKIEISLETELENRGNDSSLELSFQRMKAKTSSRFCLSSI